MVQDIGHNLKSSSQVLINYDHICACNDIHIWEEGFIKINILLDLIPCHYYIVCYQLWCLTQFWNIDLLWFTSIYSNFSYGLVTSHVVFLKVLYLVYERKSLGGHIPTYDTQIRRDSFPRIIIKSTAYFFWICQLY